MTVDTKIDLKLYKKDTYQGYDSNDVDRWMKDHNLFDPWCVWYNGQTMAVYKDEAAPNGKRFIVYSWDLEAFLSGNKPLD